MYLLLRCITETDFTDASKSQAHFIHYASVTKYNYSPHVSCLSVSATFVHLQEIRTICRTSLKTGETYRTDTYDKHTYVASKVPRRSWAGVTLKPDSTDSSERSHLVLCYTCPHSKLLNFTCLPVSHDRVFHKCHACSLNNTVQALSANPSTGNVRVLCMINAEDHTAEVMSVCLYVHMLQAEEC